MKPNQKREAMSDELKMAIGLVWGHLNVCQFDQAYQLAQGCLSRWPDEPRLALMAAYAAIEIGEPLDRRMRAVLDRDDCGDFAELVLRRAHKDAGQNGEMSGAHHE